MDTTYHSTRYVATTPTARRNRQQPAVSGRSENMLAGAAGGTRDKR
jgi:hypothetical protein